jgi:hypothetical protein
MAILRFRISLEEDDTVYRDVLIKHKQTFADLHTIILKSFDFDSKHQATFYRSNDNWDRGREISLEKYDKAYRADPLIMAETTVGSEVFDPNQKFLYHYDFAKNWWFQVALIGVTKNEDKTAVFPQVARSENIAPQQYGIRSLLGDKYVDIEEKYDLAAGQEGFTTDGEDGQGDFSATEEGGSEESSENDF